MSQGDDGAPERPASPNMPKAPPRPGAPGRPKAPPPVPSAAKRPPPPPPPPKEDNPFLAPESSRDLDAGWLAPDDAAAEASLAPPAPEVPVDVPSPAPPPPPAASPPPPPVAVASPPPPLVAAVEPVEVAPIAAADAEPAKPPSVADAKSKSVSSPPPFQKRSRGKVLALVLVPALLLVGGGFVYQSQMNARSAKIERAPQPSAEPTVQPAAPAPEPPPPPTAAAEPPPAPSASVAKKPASGGGVSPLAASADPAKTGVLDTTPLPPGRKIIVDGYTVGTSPRRVVVRCGMHRIQIGDLPPESIQLPCGGEVTFTD